MLEVAVFLMMFSLTVAAHGMWSPFIDTDRITSHQRTTLFVFSLIKHVSDEWPVSLKMWHWSVERVHKFYGMMGEYLTEAEGVPAWRVAEAIIAAGIPVELGFAEAVDRGFLRK